MKFEILISLFVCLALTACKKEKNPDLQTIVPEVYEITYQIGCTDCEVIYYKDSLENQATEYHKDNNWSHTFFGRKGQTVLLFAYNTSSTAQGVTATIKLNDSIISTHTNYCPVSGYSFVTDTIE